MWFSSSCPLKFIRVFKRVSSMAENLPHFFFIHNNDSNGCNLSRGRKHGVPGSARRSYLNHWHQQLRYWGSKQLCIYSVFSAFLNMHLPEEGAEELLLLYLCVFEIKLILNFFNIRPCKTNRLFQYCDCGLVFTVFLLHLWLILEKSAVGGLKWMNRS